MRGSSLLFHVPLLHSLKQWNLSNWPTQSAEVPMRITHYDHVSLSSWHCSGLTCLMNCVFIRSLTAHYLATLSDPETVTRLLTHQSICLCMAEEALV